MESKTAMFVVRLNDATLSSSNVFESNFNSGKVCKEFFDKFKIFNDGKSVKIANGTVARPLFDRSSLVIAANAVFQVLEQVEI